jgi:hypothetical protein
MLLNAREDNILDTIQSMGSGKMMGHSTEDCLFTAANFYYVHFYV